MRIPCLAGVTALSLALTLSAQTETKAGGAPNLLDSLPADTLFAFSTPDLATSLREFQNMPLAKMWREQEVQDFIAPAMDALQEQIQKLSKEAAKEMAANDMPITPEDAMKMRMLSMTFAVTSLGLDEIPAENEGGRGSVNPRLGFMAHLDFGDSSSVWNKLIDKGIEELKKEAPSGMRFENSEMAGVQVMSMLPPESANVAMGLHMARLGNGVVFATLADELTGTLTRLQSGDKALTVSADWKKDENHVKMDGAEAVVFARFQPMIEFAMTGLEIGQKYERDLRDVDIEGLRRAADALGLYGMESMALASRYTEDGACVTEGWLESPAPIRKGLFSGANKPLDMTFLKWVPKNAVSFTAMNIDMSSIYDAFTNALDAYNPNMAERLMGQLGKMEEQMGFKIRDDFIQSIGDQAVMWSMPMASMATAPELAILIKVRDEEKLMKSLKSLAQASDGMVEISEINRRKIQAYQLRVNYDPTGGGGMNPFDIYVPTFAFKNGYMVMGFSSGDVRRAFRRMDREDDPTGDIRGNENFAPYLAQIPKNAGSVSFTDWPAQFDGLYNMAAGLIAFMPIDDDVPIDPSLLPESSTLTQHLFGSIAWSTTEGEGYKSHARGPFGPEVVALFGAAVAGVAVFLAPQMMR